MGSASVLFMRESQERVRGLISDMFRVNNVGLSEYWINQLSIAFRILEKVDMHYDKLIEKESDLPNKKEGEK